MSLNNHDQSLIFKALGDPNRLKILSLISKQELCACKLLDTLNIAQPTLSHHMKILVSSNLVQLRKDGKWAHYSMNKDTMNQLQEVLHKLL